MKHRAGQPDQVSLGELVEFRNGISFDSSQKGRGVAMVGVGDFVRPVLTSSANLDRVEVGDLPESAFLHVDDLLFVRSNGSKDLVGRAIRVLAVDEPTTHAGFTIRARPHDPKQWSEFLWHYFQSGIPLLLMRRYNGGTNITNLSQDLLADLPVPDLGEARRPAFCRLLSTWDKKEDALARLIDAKRRFRDGMAAELLTGRRRLTGFTRRPWQEVRLGEVTRESTRRNGERLGADRVMAVTKSVGLTPMRVHTMSDSLARYKVLRPGGFAYNPMRLNIGSIARSSFKRDVLVSPDYVVFEAVAESLDPRFLDYTRRAHAWRRFMMAAGSGGVRIRIYYDDLARLQLTLPGKEEQSAIADILDTAFQEIACLTLLRETIAKQKRGLMHGLLTGKIRIKEESHG